MTLSHARAERDVGMDRVPMSAHGQARGTARAPSVRPVMNLTALPDIC
jgi:hypothetical protein